MLNINMTKFKTKKPRYKDLSSYLGVSESAVKQYNALKRDLMIKGLWFIRETQSNAEHQTQSNAEHQTQSNAER